MNNYNKKGKFFLIATIIILVLAVFVNLEGFNNNRFTGIEWFILLGTLFNCIVNLLRNIKEKKIYYAIGLSIVTITLLFFHLFPQLLIYL